MHEEFRSQAAEQLCFPSKKQILDQTLSVCSKCYKIIPAQIVENNGKIFLEKECCKKEVFLLENDAEFYKKATLPFVIDRNFIEVDKFRTDEELKEKLVDTASIICLTVNARCNLRCPICYLRAGPLTDADKQACLNEPSLSEIISIMRKHRNKLVGIVGGEPTLREDLPDIIKIIRKSGNVPFFATNGIKLLDKEYAKKIKEAGVSFVTIWFDGFKSEANRILRGEDFLELKMKILKNLRDEGLQVNLLSVIEKGLNEDQIPLLLRFACMCKKFVRNVTFLPVYLGDQPIKEMTTTSDILKNLDFFFGLNFTEQFIEEKKMSYNVHKLMKKLFGKMLKNEFSYILSSSIYLKVRGKNLRPLFSLEEVKKINGALDKINSAKNRLDMISLMIKNFGVFLNPRLFKLGAFFILDGLNLARTSERFHSDILKLNFTAISSILKEDFKRKPLQEDAIITMEVSRE
jgi:uncharacterized radical SAM superfamily Fe-S cluster-containing enzyme